MEIKNWEKLNGTDFVMDGVHMVFGDCKCINKTHYYTKLKQKSNVTDLFIINMDTETMMVTVKLANFASEVQKAIEKDDLSNLNEFLQYLRWILPFINGVHSYLTLMKSIDDLGVKNAFGSASLSGIGSVTATGSIVGNFQQKLVGKIGPVKKYMSKATTKMPVSMSIDDNELW